MLFPSIELTQAVASDLVGFSLGQNVLVKRVVGKFCLLTYLEITVLSVMGVLNLVCV